MKAIGRFALRNLPALHRVVMLHRTDQKTGDLVVIKVIKRCVVNALRRITTMRFIGVNETVTTWIYAYTNTP